MSFERLIAFHCAPALAGVKPANMFTWHGGQKSIIEHYKERLGMCGIDVEELCGCEKYSLIFIYRREMLERHLALPGAEEILSSEGYKAGSSLDCKVGVLKDRLKRSKTFPHEIGLFLGYPVEDVLGFIANKGERCKFCGNWKVYGDKERAISAFKLYDDCRDFFCSKLSSGCELTEIIHSARSGTEKEARNYYEQNSSNILERNRQYGVNGGTY